MSAVSKPNLNTTLNGYFVGCNVWPVYIPINGERRQIGFEVELVGSHSTDPHHFHPGCLECNRVRLKLLTVAETVIASLAPTLRQSVRCEIHARRASILYWPRLGNRSFVSVGIQIFHQHGFDCPIDRSEIATLNDVKESLAQLGIQHL
jgi:hypothetical protein